MVEVEVKEGQKFFGRQLHFIGVQKLLEFQQSAQRRKQKNPKFEAVTGNQKVNISGNIKFLFTIVLFQRAVKMHQNSTQVKIRKKICLRMYESDNQSGRIG